ncbi:MAG: hypothetical protein ACHP7N_17730 [Caulobacterales bacterium]
MGRSSRVLAGCAAAFLLAAGSAYADTPIPSTPAELIADFDAICMAGAADPAVAAAKARERGFTDPDGPLAKLLSSIFSSGKTTSALSIKTDAGKALFKAGPGPTLMRGKYPTATCSLAVTQFKDGDIRSAYQASFGSEAQIKELNHDIYSFAVTGQARRAVDLHADDEIISAIKAGSYRSVLVGTTEPSASLGKYEIMVLMVPNEAHKAPSAQGAP